jgi:hypothetical protein
LTRRARLRALVERLVRSEEGIALPVALMITVIALGMAAVPIVASVNSQSGDSRNQSGNEARAAAETGAELALLRQSEILPASTSPCIVESAEKKLVTNNEVKEEGVGKWCGKVSGTVGGASFTYQVRPCYPESSCAISPTVCQTPATENLIQVVSTGFATVAGRELSKRVRTNSCSNVETSTKTETVATGKTTTTTENFPPPEVFGGGQIVGIESLVLTNNAQIYNGGAGSNGSVFMTGNANACGVVRYGTTHEETNNSNIPPSNCSVARSFVKGTAEYPPVALPADISTNNSNSRLVNNGNTVKWNSSNRSLVVGNNGSLTLDGSAPYLLCSLEVTGNASLFAASGAKIHIFFEDPSKCAGLNGAPQLRIWNNAKVYPDSGEGPDFYFVGSATNPKSSLVELQGNGQAWQFVIYAPNSVVKAANNFSLGGAVIGRTLEFAGNASVNKSGAFDTPPVEEFLASTTKTTTTPETTTKTTTTSTPLAFTRRSFVECAATSTVPGSGC